MFFVCIVFEFCFLKYFVEMLMTVSARSFGLEEENIATS